MDLLVVGSKGQSVGLAASKQAGESFWAFRVLSGFQCFGAFRDFRVWERGRERERGVSRWV